MSEIIHSDGDKPALSGDLVPCWSCKGPVDRRALFCHTCSAIQPPHGIDHFSRLGMAQKFDLDSQDVERNYFRFQRIVHPDRFAAKSAREKSLSQAQAVALNDAYETLRDPLARAMHLLDLNGAALPKDDHTVRDPELLMAALEDRETLAAASTLPDVDGLIDTAQQRLDDLIEELGGHFNAGRLDAAQGAVLRLRYLEKYLDEAQAKRRKLGAA